MAVLSSFQLCANFVLVLAGILDVLGPTSQLPLEKNRMAKRGFGALCLVFGIVGLIYEATERHHAEQSSQELFPEKLNRD